MTTGNALLPSLAAYAAFSGAVLYTAVIEDERLGLDVAAAALAGYIALPAVLLGMTRLVYGSRSGPPARSSGGERSADGGGDPE